MTRNTPRRLIILQRSQIFLIEDLTFIRSSQSTLCYLTLNVILPLLKS